MALPAAFLQASIKRWLPRPADVSDSFLSSRVGTPAKVLMIADNLQLSNCNAFIIPQRACRERWGLCQRKEHAMQQWAGKGKCCLCPSICSTSKTDRAPLEGHSVCLHAMQERGEVRSHLLQRQREQAPVLRVQQHAQHPDLRSTLLPYQAKPARGTD